MFSDIDMRGTKVSLVPYDKRDIDDLYAAYGDPKVMEYIPEGTMSREWVENLVDWMVNHCYKNNTPDKIEKFGVSIKLNETGKIIGWCGLGSLDCEPSYIELFYGLASEYWGNGYATEAAELMLDYGFNTIGLNEIVALVNSNNAASRKVLENNQMKFDRIYKTDDPHFEGYNNEEFYVITSEEYKNIKK